MMGFFFGEFMLEESEFEKILKRYIEEMKKEDKEEPSEKKDDLKKKEDRTKELEKLLRNMI